MGRNAISINLYIYLAMHVAYNFLTDHVTCIFLPEQKLHHYLLQKKNYSKLIRPVPQDLDNPLGGTGKLTVELGMRLSQLLDVDTRNQIMTTNVWLRQEWNDFRLRWDPTAFDGIRMTHIRAEDLWRPDIVLYNNADGDFVVTLLTKATVYYDGKIVWEPPAIYKSYCPINMEFFPFDQQECFMKFGSWTYDLKEVDLQHLCADQGVLDSKGVMVIPRGIDLKDYYLNVEWDIINVTALRKLKSYSCCPDTQYADIMFFLTLRRRTLFYTINLIMPCISISALTVLVFYLPSDSGEKITLSISILFALTVFFLLLSELNPPTSIVIPLIGKYLLFTMLVVTLSITLTVYTLSVNFRSPATHTMSPWVKKVFIEILPIVLCMRRPNIDKIKDIPMRKENGRATRHVQFPPPGTPDFTLDSNTYENVTRRHLRSTTRPDINEYSTDVQESVENVKYVAEHLKREDKKVVRDWKFIAMVMDRLFLFIFTTACFCGTMGIFLNAPALYDPSGPMDLYDPTFNCTY